MRSFLLMLSLCGHQAWADLKFSDAIIYIPLKGSSVTAGYAVIENETKEAVTLTLQSVAGFKAVEVHQTLEKDGRAAMQKVENFVVAPKSRLVLKPGGNHMMLFDPLREFKPAEEINAIFIVNEKSQTVKMKIVARPTQ